MLVASLGRPAAAQEEGIAVGSRAPRVTVHDLDGKPVDLGQYLGNRPVLLEWWATWCEQCELLLPRLRAARAELGDKVEFIGVNVAVNQSPERVRRYLKEQAPPFLTLYDDQGTSTRAYRAPATSYVVIVDRAGTIAYTGVGGDQQFMDALQRVAAQ
jgi:thiol-disulfide isomerase/thioredoxin